MWHECVFLGSHTSPDSFPSYISKKKKKNSPPVRDENFLFSLFQSISHILHVCLPIDIPAKGKTQSLAKCVCAHTYSCREAEKPQQHFASSSDLTFTELFGAVRCVICQSSKLTRNRKELSSTIIKQATHIKRQFSHGSVTLRLCAVTSSHR